MGDELDCDWTLSLDPLDWRRELDLRNKRNELIKEKLQEGKTVAYRSSGWSLFPRVWSNDLCYYEPSFKDPSRIEIDDIVFCEVDPGKRFYAHLVKSKTLRWNSDSGREEWSFCISNMAGRENGTCPIEQVYGRLFKSVH